MKPLAGGAIEDATIALRYIINNENVLKQYELDGYYKYVGSKNSNNVFDVNKITLSPCSLEILYKGENRWTM